MKSNMIYLSLYGDPENVEQVSNHWKDDFETKQIATYSIENGLATIYALEPVLGTQLHLPLPFVVPVNDLGSGFLRCVDINCDTLRAHVAICPSPQWVELRNKQTEPPTIAQYLFAEHCLIL